MKPIARSIVITIPNCTGVSPHCSAVGRRIGARMMVAEILSMKQPTISNKAEIIISITTGLADTEVRIALKWSGIA